MHHAELQLHERFPTMSLQSRRIMSFKIQRAALQQCQLSSNPWIDRLTISINRTARGEVVYFSWDLGRD